MSKKGQYWIFAFDTPDGGIADFKFSFNTVEEFEERCANLNKVYNKYQIYNTSNRFHIEGDLGTITRWTCKNVGGEVYE